MEKKTPLYAVHEELHGKIVPFAGYLLPVQYSGVIAEHMAVRNAAGLFDVSHMGEVVFSGKDALENLNHLFTNDFTNMIDQVDIFPHGEHLQHDGKKLFVLRTIETLGGGNMLEHRRDTAGLDEHGPQDRLLRFCRKGQLRREDFTVKDRGIKLRHQPLLLLADHNIDLRHNALEKLDLRGKGAKALDIAFQRDRSVSGSPGHPPGSDGAAGTGDGGTSPYCRAF